MEKCRILLVDDVVLILEIQKSFLKSSPVQIFTAHNGIEALAIARKELPQLIFMDLHMPKMDGAACCAALKSDEQLRHIPVVMVTTAGNISDQETCRQAGCDDFITKPIDRRIFLDKGRKFLPGIDRREPRIPFRAEVNLNRGGVLVNAMAADISAGGIYVASEEAVDAGEQMELTFPISPDGDERIEVTGRVAWRNLKGSRMKPIMPTGFGVEFTKVSDLAMKKIQGFVDSFKDRK